MPKRVLVIDDDAQIRDLVRAFLGPAGYEVCGVLSQGLRTRQIPVIMLTASDDPALNRKADAAGAQACVPKPFRREGLIASLDVALAGMPQAKPSTEGGPA